MSGTGNDPGHTSRHELHAPISDPEGAPTTDEVLAAQEQSRDALEQSEMAAGRLEHAHVTRVATRVARTESRRYGMWGALFAALLGLAAALVAVSVSVSALSTAQHSDQQAAASQKQAEDTQRAVDAALAKLDEANKALEARGQAPVSVAPDPDAAEAIQAAVLAQVLVKLPKAPTADQVATELQPAVVGAVTNRATLAGLIASYFAANAPPGPTQEAIQAAVDRAYAAHPPRDGVDGRNGESPPCLAEPTACRGQNGADSTVAGPPGPPVNSWTWPDPVVPAVTHTCTRSGGDDSAANYTCT